MMPASDVAPEGSLADTLWRCLRVVRNLIGFVLSIWLGSYMLWNTVLVDGDISCDFAGQWLMGRAFYEGWTESDWLRGEWPRQTRLLYLPVPMLELLKRGYSPQAPHSRYKESVLSDLTYQILRKGYIKPASKLAAGEYAGEWFGLALPLGFGIAPLADLPWRWLEDLATENARIINPVIEGPLYPPTAGLLFLPLGLMPPKVAHTVANVLYLQMVVLCGWLLTIITGRRLVWGEGTLLVLLFPNTYQAILLGQNSVLSLTILLGGWALLVRGRPFLAGLVWGLFAYKPVFAVALVLVPIALLNWRLLSGMVVGGLTMVAMTLPFTGTAGLERFWQGRTPPTYETAADLNPWERWLIVGQHATVMYSYDRNWIWMSRDLRGLARRRMWEARDRSRLWQLAVHRFWHGVDLSPRTVPLRDLPRLLGRAPDWPHDQPDEDRPQLDPSRSEHWDRYLVRASPALPGDDGEALFTLRVKPEFWDQVVQRVYSGTEPKFSLRHPLASQPNDLLIDWPADRWTAVIGNTLIVVVGSITVLLAWSFRYRLWRHGATLDRPFAGMGAAFLLTGAMLTCVHFMHYDCLLFLLPIALAVTSFPELSWPGAFLAVLVLAGMVFCCYDMSLPNGICRPPYETFCLLFFWAWSGLAARREVRLAVRRHQQQRAQVIEMAHTRLAWHTQKTS